MQLRYDEDLVELAVTLCARRGRRSTQDFDSPGSECCTSHPLQVARFHRERERLYAILDPDERNAAFFKLHLDWFREWGMEKLLSEPLKEFPLLSGALTVLAFRQSRSKNDEGAELYVNDTGQRSGVITLRPERFARHAELPAFLRHELTHLHDMVDPAFGYEPELPVTGISVNQVRLARERYRLLWAVTIDGRLTRAGRPTVATREQRWAEFTRAFAFWPEPKQHGTFDSLWSDPAPTHRALAALVADPCGLREVRQPVPGGPCPLCGFPTFDWALVDRVTPQLAAAILAEFPAWTSTQGLCGRCYEAYQVLTDNRSQTCAPVRG